MEGQSSLRKQARFKIAGEFSDPRCLMNTRLVCLLARACAVCSSIKVIVVMLNIKVHAFLLIHY